MALEVRLVVAHALVAANELGSCDLGDPIHHDKWKTMRQHTQDLMDLERTNVSVQVSHGS
jgi:hypothetical protein